MPTATIWTTASWLNQVLFLSFFLPLMKESKFNTILLSLTTPTASWQKNQNSAQFICSYRNNQAKDSKVTSLMELLFLWYVFWYNIAFSALSSIASIGRNILKKYSFYLLPIKSSSSLTIKKDSESGNTDVLVYPTNLFNRKKP